MWVDEHVKYGARDAASSWEERYSRVLIDMGFKRCEPNPCVSMHETRDIDTLEHGDDYVSSARLERAFTLKSTIVGSDPSLGKDMVVMGGKISFSRGGVKYEDYRRKGTEFRNKEYR